MDHAVRGTPKTAADSIYYRAYRAGFRVGEIARELGVLPEIQFPDLEQPFGYVDEEAVRDSYIAGIGDGVAGYDPSSERQIDIWLDSDYGV